jgi:hypothetical protein
VVHASGGELRGRRRWWTAGDRRASAMAARVVSEGSRRAHAVCFAVDEARVVETEEPRFLANRPARPSTRLNEPGPVWHMAAH